MDIQIGRAVAGLKIKCVMSVSRLMFSDNVLALTQTLTRMGIHATIVQGAFWDQCLEGGLEDSLDSDFILTVDHDSVFRADTVEALVAVALQSGYDAIAPLQSKRMSNAVMFSQPGSKPGETLTIDLDWFKKTIQPVDTAHFGCTLIRTDTLKRMPKPWFKSEPAADGSWRGGHLDCDMHFWHQLRSIGGRLGVTPNISIGHAELMVTWPSLKTGTGKCTQYPQEFWGKGAPEEAHGGNLLQ